MKENMSLPLHSHSLVVVIYLYFAVLICALIINKYI